MKILLLTTLALISLQLKAQTWISVPDPNFQTYLTAHYPAGAFMSSGGNFYIDSDHTAIQAEDSLEISNLSISSIEGVQAFENLILLNCDYNELTLLPVDLPLNLTFFSCKENELTELPDLPLNLSYLICDNNQLINLPVLPGSLFFLACNYNLLTSLPALPNTINLIGCGGNQLTTLPVLPDQLNSLGCGDNGLTSLPDLPPYLIMLACNTNNLTELPELPGSVQTLFCGENQLTELPELPSNIQILDCQSNELTVLPDLPESLFNLNFDRNNISVIPNLPDSMELLVCSRNQLTEITEFPTYLETFYCDENDILCFAEFPVSIQTLSMNDNPFTCLPNYIPAMGSYYLSFPLCDANNPNGCSGATGIEGMVFHDINNDCVPAGETAIYIPMSVYDSTGNLVVTSTSLANGNYYFSAGVGSYELSIDTGNLTPAIHVTCPLGNSSGAVIPFADTVVFGGDFGLNCAGFDLGVQSVVPTGWVFPGQIHELSVLAGDVTAQYNMHCASGTQGEVAISITGPGTVVFGGSPTSVSGNSAVYSIADFGAVNVNAFTAMILTDTTAVGGQEFCVTVSVATNASGELDLTNNLYTYCYRVVNSHDPNIKQTYPEIVKPEFSDEFTYTIHFQNTGSAPAFNIRLADTLDPNLDLTTFKVVTASHNYTITLNPQSRLLTVRFPNIMLPDSTSNHDESIGFIQYRVKPVSGLTDGITIENTAYIYFDFNSPIVTNTSVNLFSETAGLTELTSESIQLYPNPSDNQVFIRSDNTMERVILYDLNGTLVNEISPNAKNAQVDVSDLKSGIYIATIQMHQSLVTKRLIVR